MAPDIRIQDLSKSFKDREIIKDFSLSVKEGSFVSLIGPSGCGKSTLLRLIAGLEEKSAGEITLPSSLKNSVSFVFQDANLLPWRTTAENVGLPLELNPELAKLSHEEKNKRVLEALTKVQLENFANHFPQELSGGMKMRVSLARALVAKPKFLLLDEPFAALDENTRFEMQNQLLSLRKKEKLTVIFVTHSLFEAVYLSERIIMLKGAGAKIVFDGNLDLPSERTESLRTSEKLNTIIRDLSQRLKS
ncbi:MAG: ABC transporter ATP-binding protein [Bdellovibrio sp.]|nr:ABC transporter ATP-binding protein [Bdellovibrio sp.]